MALRGKQVAKQVARQFSCVCGGYDTRDFLPYSGYVPMYDGPPPTDERISRELYRFQQNYARRFGCLNPLPRVQPLDVPKVPPLEEYSPSQAEALRIKEKEHENARKYIGLLIATENFYAGEWKTSDMAPVMHAAHPWDISPDAIAAAEYAVSFLNQKREDDEIKLKQLIRVNGQFLACTVYWLTMEASDHKFYEAIVLVSLDQKESLLKFIRPAKYYPEISPHLHYHVGPTTPELPSSGS